MSKRLLNTMAKNGNDLSPNPMGGQDPVCPWDGMPNDVEATCKPTSLSLGPSHYHPVMGVL
jgi:hypothetical protein